VLDIDDPEFRDPKVFWYAPERKWVMVVARAVARRIELYSSPDLKQWTYMSDFGPAGAVGGVWECPDLFALGGKWVMVVNLNPGAINGGSGGQYFVGDFDGRRFTAEDSGPYTPPAGNVFADFEGETYDGWTATGTAFGTRPARGTLPGQQAVTGFLGGGLVNSFIDFDGAQGTLTSPAFTVDRDHINFLVGGGPHAHVPGSGDGTPPAGDVLADFEADTYGAWTATGDLAGTGPFRGGDGREGERIVDTFFGPAGNGDALQGAVVSPEFEITRDHLSFLVAGGSSPQTQVRLQVGGETVRATSGQDSGTLNWASWDVRALRGQRARIVIADESTGGWGHVLADHFVLSDQPARLRTYETAVNLLVGGEVVRSTPGKESEALDWASWDVRDLRGRQAQIQIVDRNSGGWGHINADHFTFADAPAQSAEQRALWLDYGKDYYAAVSWNDAPGGKRLMIGWMNNWQYGTQVPTSPWRSAMSVPREVELRTVDGKPRLVQRPVDSVEALETGTRDRHSGPISGERTLATRGDVLDVRLTLRPGSAARAGIEVLGDTAVGYDAAKGEVYVRRGGSLPNFAGTHGAPVPLRDGRVRLRILVDRSLVEVFAQDGERTLAEQTYSGGDTLTLFAEGGTAEVEALEVRPLRSTWGTRETGGAATAAGSVPPTLSFTLDGPARFTPFVPGVERDYVARTSARVISTAGEATLGVSDAGHLANGAHRLAEPLRVEASRTVWAEPVAGDPVDLTFRQRVGRTDPLRSGDYARTLTFTLSTRTP
jgi:levanase